MGRTHSPNSPINGEDPPISEGLEVVRSATFECCKAAKPLQESQNQTEAQLPVLMQIMLNGIGVSRSTVGIEHQTR